MSQGRPSKGKPNKQVCIHPILFGIYPVLFLFDANFVFVDPGDLMRPLLIMTSFTALIWWIIKRRAKNPEKGALALSIGLLAFFSYGSLYDVGLRTEFKPTLDKLTAQETILFLTLVCLIIGALYLLWAGESMGPWTYLMNVLGTILVAFALVQGAKLTLYRSSAFQLLAESEKVVAGGSAALSTREKPDIYFIILDGYGRNDVLRARYDCDNSDFLQQLRGLGFFVAERSSSNYSRTLPSLGATLNYDYIDNLIEPITQTLSDRRPLRELLWRNRTVRFLRDRGYSFVTTSTQYDDINLGAVADVYLTKWWFPSQVEITLAGMTPAPTVARNLGWPVLYDHHRRRNLFALEQLPGIAELPGLKFVFTHVVSPHPPFVFGPNGEAVHPDRKYFWADGLSYLEMPGASEQEYIAGYRDQVAFLNRRVIEAVREILKRSSTPPIIIIQGDHGPGMGLGAVTLDSPAFRNRFGILNAVHLPKRGAEKLPGDISSVNTFRYIFNYYFGTDLDLLENRNYFISLAEPYNYLEVRADMSALMEPSGASTH